MLIGMRSREVAMLLFFVGCFSGASEPSVAETEIFEESFVDAAVETHTVEESLEETLLEEEYVDKKISLWLTTDEEI